VSARSLLRALRPDRWDTVRLPLLALFGYVTAPLSHERWLAAFATLMTVQFVEGLKVYRKMTARIDGLSASARCLRCDWALDGTFGECGEALRLHRCADELLAPGGES